MLVFCTAFSLICVNYLVRKGEVVDFFLEKFVLYWFAEPCVDQLYVVGIEFACRALHVFQQACFQCGAAAGERLQNQAASRGDEADKPAHQFQRFHRRMEDAVDFRPFRR